MANIVDSYFDLGNVAEAATDINVYVANAFSLQMVEENNYDIHVNTLTKEEFDEIKDKFESVVGHPDTAKILGVPYNRKNVSLKIGDILFVAQLQGGRLPEGATELPQGFKFKYQRIEIVNPA